MEKTDLYEIDGKKTVSWKCAEAEAVKARNEGRSIEIADHDGCDEYTLCSWCNQLFSKSELQEEDDLGLLCHECIAGIRAHGEELKINL